MLKEETVPLLNEYLGRMVPIIGRHHGLVNKFLGDGIMFFSARRSRIRGTRAFMLGRGSGDHGNAGGNDLLQRGHGAAESAAVVYAGGREHGEMTVGDAGQSAAAQRLHSPRRPRQFRVGAWIGQ